MESTSNQVIKAVREFNKRHDELLLASHDGTLTVIQAAKLSRAYGNLLRALEYYDKRQPSIGEIAEELHPEPQSSCPPEQKTTIIPEDFVQIGKKVLTGACPGSLHSTQDGEDTPRLARCPFCKSNENVKIIPDDDSGYQFQVNCDARYGGCGSSSGYKDTKEETAKLWNQSASPDIEEDVVESQEDTKVALHIFPVPEGWYRVSPRDTTNPGDRCWDMDARKWIPTHATNDYVSDYHCVIRQETPVVAQQPAKRRGL